MRIVLSNESCLRTWKHFLALPSLVTGSLRSKIDRILAFKQVVSTVALHGTKQDTTLHPSVRLFRCSTCRGTSIQAAKEYEKTRSLLVPLHGSQTSIANSLLFSSKKPGLPLLETKPKQSTRARTAVHWSGNDSHFTNSWSSNEAGKTSRNGDHIWAHGSIGKMMETLVVVANIHAWGAIWLVESVMGSSAWLLCPDRCRIL